MILSSQCCQTERERKELLYKQGYLRSFLGTTRRVFYYLSPIHICDDYTVKVELFYNYEERSSCLLIFPLENLVVYVGMGYAPKFLILFFLCLFLLLRLLAFNLKEAMYKPVGHEASYQQRSLVYVSR